MRSPRPPGKAGPARPFARQDNPRSLARQENSRLLARQENARTDPATRTETKVIRRFFHLIEQLEQAEHLRGGLAPAGAEQKSSAEAPKARITRLEP